MTPYSQGVRCSRCKTALILAVNHDSESLITTAFTVSCPACKNEVEGEIPFRVELTSLQIVAFDRPKK
jgi:hypothetical protein